MKYYFKFCLHNLLYIPLSFDDSIRLLAIQMLPIPVQIRLFTIQMPLFDDSTRLLAIQMLSIAVQTLLFTIQTLLFDDSTRLLAIQMLPIAVQIRLFTIQMLLLDDSTRLFTIQMRLFDDSMLLNENQIRFPHIYNFNLLINSLISKFRLIFGNRKRPPGWIFCTE